MAYIRFVSPRAYNQGSVVGLAAPASPCALSAPTTTDSTTPTQLGRWLIEHELARGAMGVVYRAYDPGAGRHVALKRLISNSPRQVDMFEREYHTLRSLRHPRIIEVFEYGVASDGAYYTMELLDGADLGTLAPLSFKRACAYLRDVASSLALLHARRTLHRDLSPRNVRVTSDDRAKLIDFGCLSSFGIPKLLAGTPPCVPPEALHSAALDQRADLFSLGALAYCLLTGRHAYPAREFGSLADAWRRTPARPSELATALGLSVPAIPHELDALVMALLTLNPMGRPASAAEVIDRLEEIAGLERDGDEAASQSYLLGVATVGRERERERLRSRLTSSMAGRGSCIVLESQSGMGSTRLLSELAVEAQLGGALPLVVDANIERGAYGVVHGLVAKLLAAAPSDVLAAAAEGHRALLARFSPSLQQALQVPPDETEFGGWPGELRKRTQASLSDWLVALAARRPLLLAIDNAQSMDDASAALLSTLADVAPSHALLIVACTRPGDEHSVLPAMRALHAAGTRMVLHGLGRNDVHALVRLLFGGVENTERLADWMHRLSGGNPRACMELAAHLVDEHVIRYIHGAWVLPQELSTLELPESFGAIVGHRIQRLPEAAQSLAQVLAVHRGALPLQRCLALAKQLAIESPHDALQTLTQEGILRVASDSYHFAHDAVRDRVLAAISDTRRRVLHCMLGALLVTSESHQDINALLDAGWHLLHGGEEERGAMLLADAGLRLRFSSDEMSASVPALRAALSVYRRLKRPVHEQLRLLTPLTLAGYYSDRRLADEFGDETLRLYQRHLGIDFAARLRPLLGRHLSMWLAIGLTGLRYMLRPALGGIRALRMRIADYIVCCTALTGVATICLDAATARRRASCIEPLCVFGSDHGAAIGYRFALLLAAIPEERFVEVIDGCTELLARLELPRPIVDLEPDARKQLHGGLLYALASMDAFRTDSRVLEYADSLERIGLTLYEMVADQLRTTYHALRGEVELADRYRARVELHAVQAGSAWQVEVWAPSSTIIVNVLTLDTIGLKRTMELFVHLANEIPSLRRNARMAESDYWFLKGNYERGVAIARPELEATPDRGFIGRTFAISNQARTLNRLGRHSEAKALVEPLVARLSEGDKQVVAHYSNLSRELALAHSGLGDHDRALAIIDAMIVRFSPSKHPLLLGNLHATAATVAMAAGQVSSALEHVTHMEDAFRPTANPALIAQCEHMRREVRRQVDVATPRGATALEALGSAPGELSASFQSLLSKCPHSDERAQLALDLLVNHARGRGGFLFSFQHDHLSLIAPQHGAEPQTEIVERIRSDIARDLDVDDVTVLSTHSRRPSHEGDEPTRTEYRTYVLTLPEDDGVRVVGALVVEAGTRALKLLPPGVLETIAYSLFGG